MSKPEWLKDAQDLPEPFVAALVETEELTEPEKVEIVTNVRRGSCQMYAPRGTKCKVCGKVHPL